MSDITQQSDTGGREVNAVLYTVQVSPNDLEAARNPHRVIRVKEIWVEQPGGKSFCMNSKRGVFFEDKPRSDEDSAPIELAQEDVDAVVAFLEARERISSVFDGEG